MPAPQTRTARARTRARRRALSRMLSFASAVFSFCLFLLHSLYQMVSHSQCIGHDGESRIHRAARAEKAAVDDIKIIHIVRFAIGVQRAGSWIVAEANRSYLMRHTGQRNALTDVEVAAEQSLMTFAAVDLARRLLLHQFFQLDDEPLVAFFVVRFVTENDSAGGIECDPIVGIGQILRREPEIERM